MKRMLSKIVTTSIEPKATPSRLTESRYANSKKSSKGKFANLRERERVNLLDLTCRSKIQYKEQPKWGKETIRCRSKWWGVQQGTANKWQIPKKSKKCKQNKLTKFKCVIATHCGTCFPSVKIRISLQNKYIPSD